LSFKAALASIKHSLFGRRFADRDRDSQDRRSCHQVGKRVSASAACWTSRDGQICTDSPEQTRQARVYAPCPCLYTTRQ